MTTSFRDAIIINGLSEQFKDDDDEFQRRVNAFIIFGLTKQFKEDDDEFQRRVNAFIIFGLSKQFKDDDEFQRRVNAFIIFGSFRRSGLFVVDPYEANNFIGDESMHSFLLKLLLKLHRMFGFQKCVWTVQISVILSSSKSRSSCCSVWLSKMCMDSPNFDNFVIFKVS